MTYQTFKTEWNNKVYDFDHVFYYQCVDLILLYAYSYGVTGIWGNAIDYRNAGAVNVRNLNNVFDWIPTQAALVGDIVVLRTNGTAPGDYSGFGHIGICDSAGATSIRLLEQNGATGNGLGQGNDKISVWRSISKSRIIGIWRPRTAPPPPPPITNRTVYLPASVRSWRLYRIGSGLRPNTTDQIAVLAPSQYGGLTYQIQGWVGDYAVIIQTSMFGKGVIWIKNTEAIID